MDRAGDQFLAGARFAADQHRGVALRHFPDHAKHALQRAAVADDAVEVVDVVLRVPEVIELVAHAPHFERLLDLHFHLFDFEGLLHVIERAALHRFHRRVHGAERRHQNHGRRRVQRLGGAEYVEAVAAAHLQVAQHHVEVAFVEPLDGLVAVRGFVHLVTRGRQRACESAPERVVVVSNQNAAHEYSFSFLLVVC